MAHTPQSGKRRFFASHLFLFLGIGALGILLLANVRTYYRDYEVETEIRALERQRDELGQKKLESMEILSYVMSDRFVEDTARGSLDMQAPGEKVIIVTSKETERTPLARASFTVSPDDPFANPKKWWYYFRNSHIRN